MYYIYQNSPRKYYVTVDDMESLIGIGFFGFIRYGEEKMESVVNKQVSDRERLRKQKRKGEGYTGGCQYLDFR